MRKIWKIIGFSVLGVILIMTLFAAAIVNRVGYDNVKLMVKLHTTDAALLPMEEEGKYLGLRKNQEDLLIARMAREGWEFQEQEGSGYFFVKGSQKAIVTIRIWNPKYAMYSVHDNVANIADESDDDGQP